MRIRVHRPVICHVCKQEMAEYGVLGWFKCLTCGEKRQEVLRPPVGR
jgi:tRNA(Ile2) C34 agmatinyltransferase TiaS